MRRMLKCHKRVVDPSLHLIPAMHGMWDYTPIRTLGVRYHRNASAVLCLVQCLGWWSKNHKFDGGLILNNLVQWCADRMRWICQRQRLTGMAVKSMGMLALLSGIQEMTWVLVICFTGTVTYVTVHAFQFFYAENKTSGFGQTSTKGRMQW